jgi:uncharacterized LabA/DUF88 family protein
VSKRIGVFCDVSNLYYCIGKKFDKRKLDYRAYLQYARDLGEVQHAIAYGAQLNNEASGFIHCLKQIGFEAKYKSPKDYHNRDNFKRKADWDVGIAIDIVRMLDRLDMIILGTADGDLKALVEYAKERGVDVVVLACGISRELKDSATKFIEIPESMLEQPKDDGQPEVEGQPDASAFNGNQAGTESGESQEVEDVVEGG